MEAYIKYLKIGVVVLWVLAIGGAVYFVFGGKETCDVSLAGKCYSQANLGTGKFIIQGRFGDVSPKIDDPNKLIIPKSLR